MNRSGQVLSKMSKTYLFDGLEFLFIPNINSSKVTFTRKNLARNGGASVAKKFDQDTTTHVLVDTKVYLTKDKISAGLKNAKVPKTFQPGKILNQTWLVDSIEQQKLLDTKEYIIKLDELKPETRKESPASKQHIENLQKQETKEKLIAESSTGNPNERTIFLLNQMAEERLLQGEHFKAKAYKNAINALNNTGDFISDANEALRLKGIGVSVAQKIEEIVKTNTLSSLNEIKSDKEHQVSKLFMGIHGVGPVSAKKWYNDGLRTLEDVSQKPDLTSNQTLGLKYYDEWLERIPRDECTLHNEFMSDLVSQIDPLVQFTIGGSYRRGSPTCGDVDFIITKPNADNEEMKEILEKILVKIEQVGYLKCSLQKKHSTKFLSGCALPPNYASRLPEYSEGKWGKCRRIDFLMVPWKERGAAFIYFTGNDYFNRLIRLKAVKNGLVLNESGLFKRIKYVQGKNVEDKTMLIESFSEKKIFKLLGFKYVPPEQRNFGANNPPSKLGKHLDQFRIDHKYFDKVVKEEIIDDDVIEVD
ncbi:DNA nucleotidylexotransferase [Wickerhamomyces ciferrii]|uniref:DNA polymerase n=1 Tax=Wickerhamomyces ciferrii (strain ATCC 14091 / BCRC 22168 / CBS 111 / JCM 3599 / NBRC 0793 / NRRL Y-1031 F-60-10) TaxID=1206466 RepID=K0KG88_WICCF|nr:DNA nucleotidylexotransferase [Wickerhamomyces ciferrii]CCH44175.1 DNA nucleotidylexotransferase [Wickerhamomyces ciferrii]